jgi:hypothetical protein
MPSASIRALEEPVVVPAAILAVFNLHQRNLGRVDKSVPAEGQCDYALYGHWANSSLSRYLGFPIGPKVV